MNWADYFYYDETSPSCLRWKVDIRSGAGEAILNVSAGSPAGSYHKRSGYYNVSCESRTFRVHRIIWELMKEKLCKGQFIDHMNGDRKDNKLCNLRTATRQTNARNLKRMSTNTSGVCGVFRTVKTVKGNKYPRWDVIWTEDGERSAKAFYCTKMGEEAAKSAAIAERDRQIARLNALGYGYTERHGK